MKDIRLIMGMPIEIEIVAPDASGTLEKAFAYLVLVDERFSTYKEGSEISRINRGELALADISSDMREVFAIAEKTKQETDGYFDIHLPAQAGQPSGTIDPSGIVKGWAIKNTAALIRKDGYENYFVNAGGDIAMGGTNAEGKDWSIGIRNPFKSDEIVKVVYPRGRGIATSGSYIRGAHIYNPHAPQEELRDIVSITVIGPDVLEADRFATAAFAMGKSGVKFIEKLPAKTATGGSPDGSNEPSRSFEAYAIDAQGIATMTSGFGVYTKAR